MRRFLITLCWAAATLVTAFLTTLPVSLQAHLIAGTIVVIAIIILKSFAPGGLPRMIGLALGTAIVLRYVYWRTTSTLPPIGQIEDFVPGFLLYLAEMYSVFMLGLSLFVVSAPLPSRVAPAVPDDRCPTVDVFVPSYNEETELLASTLAAAKAMDYPQDRFTVWLLDDGGTDQKCEQDDPGAAAVAQNRRRELAELCAGLDVRYLTRRRNEHAKAGNLNNGLDNSTGELIVVFDADHAPARSFLRQTVGYFGRDPRLFLVQTPHFFINPDPLERNLDTWDHMPSENEMFYGVIQRGLDKWDASFFCGSAAVLRREALAETGGFRGRSITEDCETALELHARGWHSIYVDTPLIAGLQPPTFASFIGQRSRWAQGMMQILRFSFPPGKRGLTFPQRLCYMSSTLFWLFPFSRIIFLVSPLFYLLFSLEIFNASGAEFLAYTSTYIVVNLLMQNYLYGRYRWPWISELYEFIQSVYLLPALLSVIANPSKPTFNVTAKGETLDESHISEIGKPFFIIFALQILAAVITAWRVVNEPYAADVTLVVGGWNLLNLVIAGCALGVVSERQNRRRSHRVNLSRRCELLIDDRAFPTVIEDVSIGGASLRSVASNLPMIERGTIALIRFKPQSDVGIDTLPLAIRSMKRDGDGMLFGCQFHAEQPLHYRLIADLIFANADEWKKFQASRRKNPGVLRGTISFFIIALYQTGRGLAYLLDLRRVARGGQPRAARAEAER